MVSISPQPRTDPHPQPLRLLAGRRDLLCAHAARAVTKQDRIEPESAPYFLTEADHRISESSTMSDATPDRSPAALAPVDGLAERRRWVLASRTRRLAVDACRRGSTGGGVRARSPLRDHARNTNVALLLALVTVGISLLGGLAPGAVAGLVTALTYNVLFTLPYWSLRINDVDDVETVVLLVLIGGIAGALVSWGRRQQREAARQEASARRLRRQAELVSGSETHRSAPAAGPRRAVRPARRPNLPVRTRTPRWRRRPLHPHRGHGAGGLGVDIALGGTPRTSIRAHRRPFPHRNPRALERTDGVHSRRTPVRAGVRRPRRRRARRAVPALKCDSSSSLMNDDSPRSLLQRRRVGRRMVGHFLIEIPAHRNGPMAFTEGQRQPALDFNATWPRGSLSDIPPARRRQPVAISAPPTGWLATHRPPHHPSCAGRSHSFVHRRHGPWVSP